MKKTCVTKMVKLACLG